MFLLKKLKKWIELEIKELEELEKDWKRRGCKHSECACAQQIKALEGVLYIIENKGVWADRYGHGIFKHRVR